MRFQQEKRSKPLRQFTLAAVTACLITLSPIPQIYADDAATGAAAPVSREYMIKAEILCNFAKFARWPSKAFDRDESPFRLCVLGDDPFGQALASIEGKQVDGRRIQTIMIADTAEARRCHMLFVSASKYPRNISLGTSALRGSL